MGALFEMTVESETLTHDEVVIITGCKLIKDQAEWLSRKGWTFVENKAGKPIVGRLYARLKLAGINPTDITASGGWSPDLSQVK